MHICGFQKTTLLDYPEHLAATIFLGGCNFRCPFCHNADLVLHPELSDTFSEEEIVSFLKQRKNVLQGVCITGGEPTLSPDLPQFLSIIKELGYLIKLDTNGSNPKMVKQLYHDRLIDYVAMDIKSGSSDYATTCGLPDMSSQMLSNIKESIRFLIHETDASRLQYEFRTTCVAGLHTKEAFREIGELISGAEKYYIQFFVDSDFILCRQTTVSSSFGTDLSYSLHAHTKDELLSFLEIVKPYVKHAFLRGVD